MVSRLTGIFRRNKVDPECEEIRNQSSDYVDEDLAQDISDRISQHLSKCPPCHSFINTLKATVGLLRNSQPQEAPNDFKERIRRNLRENR